MASDRRSSLSSSSLHSHRRGSSSSVRLPPLPPSTESLTSNTSNPAAAPAFGSIPPPKDPAPPPNRPATPVRKPAMRQKSPLSNEAYIASPASSMPGTFPSTPPATAASVPQIQSNSKAHASPSTITTVSANSRTSPKRPGSIRSFLSFKAMRRSSHQKSPEQPRSPEYRPMTPGAESLASSSRQSLNKKRSGTFWKRKSSLGMSFGRDSEDAGSASASPGGMNGNIVIEEDVVAPATEEGRSITPAPGTDFPTVSKRKSGTFWRRRSSLSLATAFRATSGTGATIPEENRKPTAINGEHTATTNGTTHTNGVTDINGHHSIPEIDPQLINKHSQRSPLQSAAPILPQLELSRTRSPSPPPQLPAFIGGGGSLDMGDLLKGIE